MNAMTDTTQTMTLRLARRIDEPGNIARLRLAAPDGAPLPAFTAGAHLDIHVVDGDVDLWRQYSLCSDPAETGFYEIGVLRDPQSRGGSETLHRIAQEGASFEVEGPRNHFPLTEDAPETVLLGGGIGITPMIAMARRLHALGKPFTLHYATRSRDVTAFLDEIAQSGWSDRTVLHHDDLDAAQKLDPARDLPPAEAGAHLYICGPQGFMDWLIGAAEAQGYPSARIHREYFSAEVDLTGNSFEVECAATGVTVTVGPDETIAKVLAANGIKVEVKCEEGVCGTCLTDVIEGEIDHRDQFLTDEERAEGELICVCCSRARGAKLVLDI